MVSSPGVLTLVEGGGRDKQQSFCVMRVLTMRGLI